MRKPGEAATTEELSSAALQFVRKISGFHKPSRANQEAFERAVHEISEASDRLLKSLGAPQHEATAAIPSATDSSPTRRQAL